MLLDDTSFFGTYRQFITALVRFASSKHHVNISSEQILFSQRYNDCGGYSSENLQCLVQRFAGDSLVGVWATQCNTEACPSAQDGRKMLGKDTKPLKTWSVDDPFDDLFILVTESIATKIWK